ncbi:MAG TPA: hypothetical protein VG758_07310 [Hyphomicrobiaceae bacterium]|jgi:hypothetical protein|nr:hypothetical protein [Hyphomicrobiaceae bacterium]
MIFTHATRMAAIVVIVWGAINALLGLAFATGMLVVPRDSGFRFSPSGQMIDKGIYAVLVGLALGTLAEISYSVRRNSQ